jgi:hypothetical protein
MSDEDDVEKRWHDPAALRAAIWYVTVVVVVAGCALAGLALGARTAFVWAAAIPAILFVGALGAFVKTYRDWRAQRTWPIWQGAGWFLLALTLLAFSFPAAAILGGPP